MPFASKAAAAYQAGGGFFQQLIQAVFPCNGLGNALHFRVTHEQAGICLLRLILKYVGIECERFLGAQEIGQAIVRTEFDQAVLSGEDDFIFVDEITHFKNSLTAIGSAGDDLPGDESNLADNSA